MKTIIIGGVAGGMSAATRLRRLDERADITVYEQGPFVSFANCGLPYFVGEVIPSQRQLLLQTPKSLFDRFRLDVQVECRVVAIDPQAQTVTVKKLTTGEEIVDRYDALIISTGATPRELSIPGQEAAMVLQDVPDAVAIREAATADDVSSVVIMGGGFIGVELAENLRHLDLDVTIVQSQPSILPGFDPEIVEPFQANLVANGITLELGCSVTEITASNVTLSDGRTLPADLVVSAVGVVPNRSLAAHAGLRIGASGGIWVDDQQRTSDPHIYAVGDAAEKTSAFTGEGQLTWLANLANRHGRLVADVLAGVTTAARPALGTGIVGAFGMAASLTGLSEKRATALGIPHSVIHLHPGSHVGYYPGAERVSLKVLFDPSTGRLLGAQAVGRDGVDKRIDVIATAIYGKLTVDDLMNLELAYAPQFGSAKDAINQAGYVGNNVFAGNTPSVQWHELEARQAEGWMLVDVRTSGENEAGAIPGSVLIPVDDLRERLDELANRQVIVHCQVGQRGHTATQILRAHGVAVTNLDGGYLTWRAGMDARARA
jgi:NADPH-dependent 2,4-dienoyl-CoA reductase/sulfur reductase-like enzyme/rhodanese-related sulfurtransferase